MTLTQRSTAWRMLRCGDVTASRLKDIKPPRSASDGVELSNGEVIGKTALSYLEELIAELITGKPQDRGRSQAMDHGMEYEDIHRQHATEALRERFGEDLILPEGAYAYLSHPTEANIGCSPDYVVGEKAGGEMKCPFNPANHVAYIRRGLAWFLKDHRHQVQGSIWINDWDRYYVSSYHPDFPEHLQLIMWEVRRDDEFIDAHAPRWIGFRDLVLEEYQRLIGGPF